MSVAFRWRSEWCVASREELWLGAPQTPLNLDGSEHGGLQPPRQDAVVWRRLPAFTAVRIPRRMARHFEWTTRRSRVGTDRFGTGRVVLAAEYQPGYDGLPGGAQGLRALRIDSDQDYDDDQDSVGFDDARDKA